MRRTPPARLRRARQRSGGFSLIEVVIAMGILAFGLLTLALMQLHALTQGSAGRHTHDAAAIGRSYVEQVNRLPWTTLTPQVGLGWQAPAWAGVPDDDVTVDAPDGSNTLEHAYTIAWRVTAIGASTCLRDVEVRVSWAEEDHTANKQVVLATRRYDVGGASC